MFHIVFDPGGAKLISEAMDMEEALEGEIILLHDDYSVGPVQDLFSSAGREERAKWWSFIRGDQNVTGESESDDIILGRITQRMEEEEFDQIWIWVAPNAKDVSGYYWLIAQLRVFAGRIYVLHLNNLPFINEKGNVFYPVSLSEIPVREFIKARKLARPVTSSEFEIDPDEWLKLSTENKNLRLLEGAKKIVHQPDDFIDKTLLHTLQPVFHKIPRTIQQFLSKSTGKINEDFLVWRLKTLVAAGLAEQQGESVRLLVKEPDRVDI